MDDMDFDSTQVLHLNEYLDDTEVEEEENITTKTPVGHLKVFQSKDFPETSFPIYDGDNFIGRDDRCNITIPAKPISKKHACIEVHDGVHLVYDCNSRNKTKKNKIFLKPQVRYELQNDDQLMFADVNCQYLFGNEADDEHLSSDSETGSESMLLEHEKETEDHKPDQDSRKLTSSPKSEDDLNKSLNINVEQAQDCKPKNLGAISPMFCPETDDETDDEQETSKKFSDKDSGLALYSSEENKQPVKAVDAKCDPFKRSAGNTLDYGLQTLHNPNFSKDSADISGNESGKDSRKSTPVKKSKTLETPEKGDDKPKKDHEIETMILNDDTSRESTPVEKSKTLEMEKDADKPKKDNEIETTKHSSTLNQTPPEEDTVLHDLMATQLYEVFNVPESPVSSDEAPAIEQDRVRTSEEDTADATQGYAVTSGNDSPGWEALEDIPTLPYEDPNEDPATSVGTGDELATQAYGLSNNDNTPVEETGNKDTTKVCGHGDNDGDSARREESGDEKNNEFGNKEADQEPTEIALRTDNDLQSTQNHDGDDENKSFDVNFLPPVVKANLLKSFEVNFLSPVVTTNLLKKLDERKNNFSKVTFVDTSDSESTVTSNYDVKPEGKPDESSDSELPSLSDIGISMTTEKSCQDSAEEFLLPGPSSSRKRTPDKKLTSVSVLSVTKNSTTIIIEGENSLSCVKRCYVECTPEGKARPYHNNNTCYASHTTAMKLISISFTAHNLL